MTLELSLGGFQKVSDLSVGATQTLIDPGVESPLVSILCTSRGANPLHLEVLCHSLTKQDGFNFELIVVACTKRDTEIWEDALRDRTFRYWLLEDYDAVNRTAAFKTAYQHSRADWNFVLDADDFLQENAIPYAYWVVKRFPQFRVFCSNHARCDEGGSVFSIVKYDPHEQRPECLSIAFKQRHFWGFHKNIVDTIPGILDSPWLCEDYWFFSRCAMRSEPVLHIPKTLYFYRLHWQQMTSIYKEDMAIMCQSIRNEIHRWVCRRTIGNNLADGIMAERIVRTAQALLDLQ